MSEHDRNEKPVYSEWIPREAVAGGDLDWSKLQIVPAGDARHDTGADAAGHLWFRVCFLCEAGLAYFHFRLL